MRARPPKLAAGLSLFTRAPQGILAYHYDVRRDSLEVLGGLRPDGRIERIDALLELLEKLKAPRARHGRVGEGLHPDAAPVARKRCPANRAIRFQSINERRRCT